MSWKYAALVGVEDDDGWSWRPVEPYPGRWVKRLRVEQWCLVVALIVDCLMVGSCIACALLLAYSSETWWTILFLGLAHLFALVSGADWYLMRVAWSTEAIFVASAMDSLGTSLRPNWTRIRRIVEGTRQGWTDPTIEPGLRAYVQRMELNGMKTRRSK